MTHIVEKDWISNSGYRCVCLIAYGTHRCGYVGVPPAHPFHGIGYHEQTDAILQASANNAELGQKGCLMLLTATCGADDDQNIRRSPDIVIDCHGGLTYSSAKAGEKYPVSSDDLWWFGFDCAHAGDKKIDGSYLLFDDGTVRSLGYVIDQCESIAQQLKEYA